MLAGTNCNMDCMMTISFAEQNDARDERWPIYSARLVLPGSKPDSRPKFMSKTSIWSTASFMTKGFVAELPRMKTKDMVEIESMHEQVDH